MADKKRTHAGHMVDTHEAETRGGQGLEVRPKADTWRTQGGHMADIGVQGLEAAHGKHKAGTWGTQGEQMAGKVWRRGQSGLKGHKAEGGRMADKVWRRSQSGHTVRHMADKVWRRGQSGNKAGGHKADKVCMEVRPSALKADPRRTHGGQSVETRPKRNQGGQWRTLDGQVPGTRPAFCLLRENPAVN